MSYGESTPALVERIGAEIVDAPLTVHRKTGPGLLESVYEICMAYELRKRGLNVERQVVLPLIYDGVQLDAGLRIDLLVENLVIIERKSVEKMNPVFEAQILTQLKLSDKELGFLINFDVILIRDGIKRFVRSNRPSD